MITNSLLLLSAAVAAGAIALPLESEIQPRVCGSVSLPSVQNQLFQAAPDVSFPNTALTDK